MSTLEVNTITPQSGTTLTLGGSGDTINLGSGVTASGFGGITVATEFRLTADTNTNTNGDITTNWEVVDDASYSSLGSPVTESSGVFSFPQTGIYLAICTWMINITGSDTFAGVQAQTTLDNSSYTIITENSDGANHSRTGSANSIFIVDVTDISNVKVKFRTDSFGNANLGGSTTVTKSGVAFIRLGDT